MLKHIFTPSQESILAQTESSLNHRQDFQQSSQDWLNSGDLSTHLPDFDWGEQGMPEGQTIHYQPGIGLVVG